jgi:hypothetical protein
MDHADASVRAAADVTAGARLDLRAGPIVLARDEMLGPTAGSELLDALRIARLVGWTSVVVDLLAPGVLTCAELSALIREFRHAVDEGMAVCVASTDQRLINVLDMTGVPIPVLSTVSDAHERMKSFQANHSTDTGT